MVTKVRTVDPPAKILRRKPKQDRSRDRIKDILEASANLIRERGIDAVTMKEIGARTGGPIATVYQYFPDKTAILAMLYERRANEVRRVLQNALQDISRDEDIIAAQSKIIDGYYELMRADPNAIDTLNAIKACKKLSVLDLTKMRARVNEFFEATASFVDPKNRDDYKCTLFLLSNMADATVRLAILQPEDQGREILQQFKVVARTQMVFHLTGKFPAPHM